MKMKEIKELTAEELVKKIEDLRKESFNLRQQAKTGTLENTAKLKLARRDIARCLTEQKLRTAAQA